MTDDSLTFSFTVALGPEAAYALINDVRGWWEGDVEGPTDTVGAEFTYRSEPHHVSTQRVTELVPGRRIAWHVVAADLSFVSSRAEWRGTDITFDITPVSGGSEIRFTHRGLVPSLECFEGCSAGWRHYAGTVLRDRLAVAAART